VPHCGNRAGKINAPPPTCVAVTASWCKAHVTLQGASVKCFVSNIKSWEHAAGKQRCLLACDGHGGWISTKSKERAGISSKNTLLTMPF